MVQIRDAWFAQDQEPPYDVELESLRDMNKLDTLGLEGLGIAKPKRKRSYRKARAKSKAKDQESTVHDDCTTTVNQQVTTEQPVWPPPIPSYHSLPVPPLGSLPSQWAGHATPDPNSNAYGAGASYMGGQFKYVQDAARYQPGRGFTPINGPSGYAHLATAWGNQLSNPFGTPATVGDYTQGNPVAPITQKSSLSVLSYHGLPSFRIDKQRRHTKARLAQEPVSSPHGRWTGAPHKVQSSAPVPTPVYLTLAHTAPFLLPSPQRLLLVLDLNGTLLYRSNKKDQFSSRPLLENFLNYALTNHSVLIWSSATPKNVKGMCQKLFTPVQRQLLLGEWGRDTLELTPCQYQERVQVYKRLDRIWCNHSLQCAHPGYGQGERWGQHNTLLIDDSIMKASAQPFNHIEVPEFVHVSREAKKSGKCVLEQVVGYLEYARRWSDVSGFVREMKFAVNEGWGWGWTENVSQNPEGIADDEIDEYDQDDDGGVKI